MIVQSLVLQGMFKDVFAGWRFPPVALIEYVLQMVLDWDVESCWSAHSKR
jgi:hypothetical protein